MFMTWLVNVNHNQFGVWLIKYISVLWKFVFVQLPDCLRIVIRVSNINKVINKIQAAYAKQTKQNNMNTKLLGYLDCISLCWHIHRRDIITMIFHLRRQCSRDQVWMFLGWMTGSQVSRRSHRFPRYCYHWVWSCSSFLLHWPLQEGSNRTNYSVICCRGTENEASPSIWKQMCKCRTRMTIILVIPSLADSPISKYVLSIEHTF